MQQIMGEIVYEDNDAKDQISFDKEEIKRKDYNI